MNLIAHLTMDGSTRKEETLREHCFKTAAYAAQSIGGCQDSQNSLRQETNQVSEKKHVDMYHLAYVSGLIHDMGKGKQEFIQYIEDAFCGKKVIRGSVNHTFAGVIWIMEQFHTKTSSPWEKMASEVVSFAIGSHHGMFDCVDLDGRNGFQYRQQKDKEELHYEEAVRNYFEQVIAKEEVIVQFQKAVKEVKCFYDTAIETQGKNKSIICFWLGMLARLVLSSVIYGDRRDTCEFMVQKMLHTDNGITWKDRCNYFEDKLRRMPSGSEINQVRNEISSQCIKAAGNGSGIYRMNIPTGGGKTLSCLRYALAHAQRYQKKRIIFVIPLLSVLDQNVKVIRDFVPDPEAVLEHHSNVVREQNVGDDLDRCEFLTESWNYPIVVSTLVQLLRILFGHQTSAVGRMQALCDSVIVIDEVQTLPKRSTLMFNMAMNFLQAYCGTTIILSSATQPCFDELKWPLQLAEEPDLVRLDRRQLAVFQRAKLVIDRQHPYGMNWDTCTVFCSELMEKHSSLLVICNTKSEALTLYRRMKRRADCQGWAIFHLSTAMCQQNRMDVLDDIQEQLGAVQAGLRKGKTIRKVICIATQIVEAGVDFSFEGVVRVLAGVDNLAQAAGRCNRSNEYGHLGIVYLISLKNENLSMLRDIRNAQNCTRKVLDGMDLRSDDDTLIGGEAAQKFYHYLYQETERELEYPVKLYGEVFYLTRLLANQNISGATEENRNYFLRQPFRTIGENFKVFDENTMDVFVPYQEGADLVQKLECLSASEFQISETKELMRQAKHYSISIYDWQKQKLEQAGLLRPVLGGRSLVLDKKAYDNHTGLVVMEEQPVENLII